VLGLTASPGDNLSEVQQSLNARIITVRPDMRWVAAVRACSQRHIVAAAAAT
jgi:hypothetical protein